MFDVSFDAEENFRERDIFLWKAVNQQAPKSTRRLIYDKMSHGAYNKRLLENESTLTQVLNDPVNLSKRVIKTHIFYTWSASGIFVITKYNELIL